MNIKITFTITLLLIAQLVVAQDKIQRIDSLLTAMYANKSINGNFLVAEKGKVIYSKSFGFSNENTKEKLNEHSVFELASVTKQFTAMAIAILQEKGKLNYDDKISKYIPEFSNYDHITIKNLLYHTSGLPDYMTLLDSLFDKSKIATNRDIILMFANHKPKMLFEPNTKFEYSNTGYALLASIIEKASGLSYNDYLNKSIFGPLNMKNTFVHTRRFAPKKIKNYAYGYVYADSLGKYILPDDSEEVNFVVWLDGVVGDKTVNSTVNDLLKWDRALYMNKLLSKSSMELLYEGATLNNGSKTQYGFGWFLEDHVEFRRTVDHEGTWPGYKTFIARYIDSDKTIIILQNHGDVSHPIRYIRSILYSKPVPVQNTRKEVKLTN